MKQLNCFEEKELLDNIVKSRNLNEAEKVINMYLDGEIAYSTLGSDIITTLVSMARDDMLPAVYAGKMLEQIVITPGPKHVLPSTKLGEAAYALRELAERFYYTLSQIQAIGNRFNENNANRVYSLTAITYTSREGKQEKIEFEQKRAA